MQVKLVIYLMQQEGIFINNFTVSMAKWSVIAKVPLSDVPGKFIFRPNFIPGDMLMVFTHNVSLNKTFSNFKGSYILQEDILETCITAL